MASARVSCCWSARAWSVMTEADMTRLFYIRCIYLRISINKRLAAPAQEQAKAVSPCAESQNALAAPTRHAVAAPAGRSRQTALGIQAPVSI